MDNAKLISRANRDYWPILYDREFARGEEAFRAGMPRVAPNCFQYSYEAHCFFDGWDTASGLASARCKLVTK